MIVDNYTSSNQMFLDVRYEFLFYERQTSTIADPSFSVDTIKVRVKKLKFM
jgi:hypothetical protein